ncbi:MAG TPA: carbohydrate ABC transporter permease, partial [Kribbella sp.]
MRRQVSIGRTVAWILLFVLLIVTLFPFYWMLRTAFSDNTQLPGHPHSLLPVETTLGAFKRVLGLSSIEEAQAQGGSGAAVNFWLYLRNSLVVATVTTVCQVFFSAMAAYAFARLRWPGRDKVFALFLAALMVPPIFTTLPNFVLIKNLGLLNSFAGIILPGAFMTPFAIFF